MNIRLIHSVIRRTSARVLAITAATALTAFSGGATSAQTGLVNRPANPGAMSSVGGPSYQFGPGTKIIPASAVATAADVSPGRLAPGAIAQALASAEGDVADAGSIAQVNYSCQGCVGGTCNGGCGSGSCGTSGYGSSAYGGSNVCGVPCDPYSYVTVEALYMDRRGISNRALTRNTRLDNTNFEFAPRLTIGVLPNCVNGYEFTFVGQTTWDRGITVNDPNGNLFSILSPGANFDGTYLDPFVNSNVQTLQHSSEYWSVEFNKTCVGWDVAKVLFGGRYISIEDRLLYAAQKDIYNSNADLTSHTHNDMLGVQAGLDLLFPLTQHLYTDFRGRAGLFIDFADSDVHLRNQGQTVVRNFSDDTKIAGVFEIGGGLRYQLGPMLSVRAGGEMWYLSDFASGDSQINAVVSNALGNKTETRDIFYLGGTFGAELKF